MLISQEAKRERTGGQGCRQTDFVEVRQRLERPSELDDGHRQRLLDMATRVARVQALGGAYRRVSLSAHAMAAIDHNAALI